VKAKTLLERLRFEASCFQAPGIDELLSEAADRIEELEADDDAPQPLPRFLMTIETLRNNPMCPRGLSDERLQQMVDDWNRWALRQP
jgi:hypothetical protein